MSRQVSDIYQALAHVAFALPNQVYGDTHVVLGAPDTKAETMTTTSLRLPALLFTLLFALAGFLVVGLPGPPAHAASVAIPSERVGSDSGGSPVQAHGGGMLKVGNTYYWVGEDKLDVPRVEAWAPGTYTVPFTRIRCYSSTNLRDWTFQGNVLTRQASGDLGPNRVVERPKLLFNAATNRYVLWLHIDNTAYSEAKVGVATSATPCGSYSYQGSFRPLSKESRDFTVFQDTDGAAFLVHSSDGNTSRRVVRLSSDYTSVTSQVAQLGAGEAPAVFKSGGTYVMLSSSATGWTSNDNFYATATSMAGPWTERGDFTPSSPDTFDSQTAFVLPVSGTAGTTYMYLGDRWQVDAGSTAGGWSPYVWLPLTLSGTTLRMQHYATWNVDTATGTWTAGASSCTAAAGVQYRLNNVGSDKALNVAGSSAADGAPTEQWPFGNWGSQKWTFASAGSGYVTITNVGSGKRIDVNGASTGDGAAVVQWFATTGTNQQWTVTDSGGGRCRLTNRNSGKVMDVANAVTTDGARVVQWPATGGANQAWSLVAP